jgi:hypothetical protein
MDEPTRTEYFLGLDLGQSSDPSALTVTERRTPLYERGIGLNGYDEGTPTYTVVHIHRFDLGTSYTDVVDEVAAVQESPVTGDDPPLVMDATGVGAPVVNQFQDEGLRPVQVLFTSGDEVTQEGRKYKVPKADLVTSIETLLQAGRLQIVESLDEAAQLVEEMRRFRVKYTPSGHARFEHATEADSDDVLLSLACALWYAENAPLRSGGGVQIHL